MHFSESCVDLMGTLTAARLQGADDLEREASKAIEAAGMLGEKMTAVRRRVRSPPVLVSSVMHLPMQPPSMCGFRVLFLMNVLSPYVAGGGRV